MANFFDSKVLMKIRQNMATKLVEFTGVEVQVFAPATKTEDYYGDREIVEDDPITTFMRFTPEQGLRSLQEFNSFFDGANLPMKVLFPQDIRVEKDYRILLVTEDLLEDGEDVEWDNNFRVVDVIKQDASMQVTGTKIVFIAPYREAIS